MKTDGTINEGRQEPRMSATASASSSQEPVFGDPRWVAEHLDWIRRHYRREDTREGVAA